MKSCPLCFASGFVVQLDGVLTCACGHWVTLCNNSLVYIFPNYCVTCGCGSFRIRNDGVLTCAQGHIIYLGNGRRIII